jgi:hypothetical protein
MKDEMKDDRMERRMKMWKMRQEMINSMGEKELKAFITGYMMAESMILRKLSKKCSCGGGCGQGCGCGQHGGECGCGKGDSCNCESK